VWLENESESEKWSILGTDEVSVIYINESRRCPEDLEPDWGICQKVAVTLSKLVAGYPVWRFRV